MRRRKSPSLEVYESPTDALCRRAFRFRRRGERRRAMLALRQAAYLGQNDARLWTLYGAQCLRMGRVDAARKALGQAIWLRERQNEPKKAAATRQLLTGLAA